MNSHEPHQKEIYHSTVSIPRWSWAIAILLSIIGWGVIILITLRLLEGLS
jgi:hypothetical protein